ncbi:MAG: ABC transporter permease [Caldilineales bacterium]
MAFYLAFKEIWHSRGRYLLIAGIVALITTLVLFIAALAEGLGNGNREYLQKLNGELIVYQQGVDLSISASRLGRSTLAAVRRVEGVAQAGQVNFSSSTLVFSDGREALDVSLVGVEPGLPGEPPAFQGNNLSRGRANEAILDRNTALRANLQVGDTIVVKSTQGTEEKQYPLAVTGITDGRQYFLQPSIFVPMQTWEKVRPGGGEIPAGSELVSNIIAVRLADPAQLPAVQARLLAEVSDIETADRTTAYEATPGYSAQQSTLNTQRYFTLLIGILVIGGFFQIQTLQKIAQIGMLKAIGTTNGIVALAAIVQIVAVNTLGVLIGAAGSLLLSLTFPVQVPIVFTPNAVIASVLALLIIGPLGGLVSVWALSRVEPLRALGLAQ